jgi:hypothetical protein
MTLLAGLIRSVDVMGPGSAYPLSWPTQASPRDFGGKTMHFRYLINRSEDVTVVDFALWSLAPHRCGPASLWAYLAEGFMHLPAI